VQGAPTLPVDFNTHLSVVQKKASWHMEQLLPVKPSSQVHFNVSCFERTPLFDTTLVTAPQVPFPLQSVAAMQLTEHVSPKCMALQFSQ
jgi:hypothetical protein